MAPLLPPGNARKQSTGPRMAPRGRLRHKWLLRGAFRPARGARFVDTGRGVVVRGLRCDERELAKLFPEEAAAVARATLRDDDPSVPEIVHGRCGEGLAHERLPVYVYGRARPRAARLMVERTRGAGDAEVYSCANRAAVVVADAMECRPVRRPRRRRAEAVDPALFSPAAAARDDDARFHRSAARAEASIRVLSIFKWERRKAPDVLVDGFFRAFQDESAELVIHAYRPSWERGDKDLQRVAERMRPAGNKARLTWLGGVELTRRELRALYAAVDCFALPTRGEGWGLPVHEALAMALPTVVTGVAGPRDITGGNGTAWLLDPGGRGADGRRGRGRRTWRRRCAKFATIRLKL